MPGVIDSSFSRRSREIQFSYFPGSPKFIYIVQAFFGTFFPHSISSVGQKFPCDFVLLHFRFRLWRAKPERLVWNVRHQSSHGQCSELSDKFSG
jgi:hypothetical protein